MPSEESARGRTPPRDNNAVFDYGNGAEALCPTVFDLWNRTFWRPIIAGLPRLSLSGRPCETYDFFVARRIRVQMSDGQAIRSALFKRQRSQWVTIPFRSRLPCSNLRKRHYADVHAAFSVYFCHHAQSQLRHQATRLLNM